MTKWILADSIEGFERGMQIRIKHIILSVELDESKMGCCSNFDMLKFATAHFPSSYLFRSKNPVPGVSQPRTDISVLIQASVKVSYINLDIGMSFVEAF